MAFLRMPTFYKYLNAVPDSRCVTEGEELYFASQLVKCGLANVEGCKYEVIALCLQTSALTDKPHQINGELLIQAGVVKIHKFSCNCKAGLSGVCKHVSACLFYCSRNNIIEMPILTTTDLECYWSNTHKTSVRDTYAPKPINKSSCAIPIKRAKELTKEQQQKCFNAFRQRPSNRILYKHFSKTCGGNRIAENSYKPGPSCAGTSLPEKHQKTLSKLEQAVIDNMKGSTFISTVNVCIEDCNLKQCCRNVLNILSTQNRQEAAAVTQGSDEWKELRPLRITGSTCYSVYTYSKTEWEKKANSLFCPNPIKTPAMAHGNKYEKFAFEKYKETCGADKGVINMGFVISHVYPWLGFSPDGVVIENGHPIKLIEIKCPLKGATEAASSFAYSCKYLKFEGENLT